MKKAYFMLIENERVKYIFLGNKILKLNLGFPSANLLMTCFEHI